MAEYGEEMCHPPRVSSHGQPHDQIADLEAEIDRLSDEAERCRKVMIVAKALCATGGLLLVYTLLGRAAPIAFVFAIAAILGGIALFGSNKSTRDQIRNAIRSRKAQRAKIIERLKLYELGT